jgi:hypothetical protein
MKKTVPQSFYLAMNGCFKVPIHLPNIKNTCRAGGREIFPERFPEFGIIISFKC